MLFYFACEAAGASAPGIPHALLMGTADKFSHTSDAFAPRERGRVCCPRRMPIDVVIASAAKQSSFLLSLTMDCFAALRNDGVDGPQRHQCARLVMLILPDK